MEHIATFYSHFAAISYKAKCKQKGITARLMPVPRSLSSSCGTCVSYEGEPIIPDDDSWEVEGVYRIENGEYKSVYLAEG